jgi:flagellar biosynthesis/type III secretory pathway chaperone
MADQPSTRMLALLDKERTAIRMADFAQLEGLADQKAHLIAALTSGPNAKSNLIRIKAKLDENQSLLRAAISGVAAAQDRIAALRNVREELSVYDQSGQMAKVPTRRPDMEKKA